MKDRIHGLAGFLALAAFAAAAAPAAAVEVPPVRASDLRLRASDLPAGWTVLPKEEDTEEVAKIKEVVGLASKQIGGFQADFQGIGAAGTATTVAFFGFPDDKAMKQFGPFVSMLFAKRNPKAYGTVYALPLTDDPKTAATIHKAVASRYASARLAPVDALVAQGKLGEAADLLNAVVPLLGDAPAALVRAGDLYFYSLRPPEAKKAFDAYAKAVSLHARDPLDPVLLGEALQGSGSSRLVLGEKEKARDDFERGSAESKAVAPRLAARILREKARVHIRLNDEEGCHASLQASFELDAALGFGEAAAGFKDDPDFGALARKTRFSALAAKFAKTKALDAFAGAGGAAFDPAKDPLILLPPLVEGRVMPDLKLDEALEKALLAKAKGGGVIPDGTQGQARTSLAFLGGEIASASWESIEQLGCFDLRLAGSLANRGRGAEFAALASERARAAQMAFGGPVRVLGVRVRVDQDSARADLTVTAALADGGGALLLLARFKKSSATTTVALRTAMAESAAEVFSRFAKARK